MDSIDLMIKEHTYIKRMLLVIRKACIKILNKKEIVYEDFDKMISFIRNYADLHHHGKEEDFLFNRMTTEIGGAAEKIVKFGMLVEHDFGRFFIKKLEEALKKVKEGDDEAKVDVIANAISYTDLLNRHIEKEDNVVYPFAKRELSEATLKMIDSECEEFEEKKKNEKVQEMYIKLLEELEKKYLDS